MKAIFFDVDRSRSSGTLNFTAVRDLVEAGLATFAAGGTRHEDLDSLQRLGAAGLVMDALEVLRLEGKENEGKDALKVEEERTKPKRASKVSREPSPMRASAPNPWE
jgi:hypothetical protein